MQTVIIAGRLPADPQCLYTEEKATATFKVTVKGKNESEEINCIAHGGLAKIVGEYLKAGRLVAVEGRLNSNTLTVDSLQLLDPRYHKDAK